MPAHLENSAVATGLEKVPKKIPKKGNAKERSNYHTIALISHARKVMLKILQASLPQYMNQELEDVQDGFRKGRGTRYQITNIHWIIDNAEKKREREREFQKNNYFHFIQFSSVAQSCPTVCDPMNHSTPGLPVHHQLPESTQTHVH